MGDIGTTSAFHSARPEIRVEDEAQAELSEGLLSLLVEETTDGLYRCEATFGNWGSTGGGVGFLYLDRALLDFGKAFSILAGSDDATAQIFIGRITGLEARYPQGRPPEVLVLAEDRFQDLRMTRRTRTFEDLADRDVFEQIAADHSLRTVLDLDGPSHPVLAQVNQSDLAFLRDRARALDAELWVENDTLYAQARARRSLGDVTLTYGQSLREFSVLADVARQRTSLFVSGWDVATKEGIEHEAAGQAVQSELNGHVGGAAVLEQAFGVRAERLVHMAPFSQEEARILAEAHFRQGARRFLTGRGVAEGDGRIRVGVRLKLEGLGPLFEGTYYVAEVRHTFEATGGFRTHFKVERPGLGVA